MRAHMTQRFFGRHGAGFERLDRLAEGLVHGYQSFFKVIRRSTLQVDRTFNRAGAVFELVRHLVNLLDRALQA